VLVETHKPPVPTRSPEQRLGALAHANEVRLARAQLKRDLAAGRLGLAEVLSEPPACAQMARVRELLLAVPGIGPAKADRAFIQCRIAYAKTVAGLSGRQRAELVELLRR
jgi:hypothetical protein